MQHLKQMNDDTISITIRNLPRNVYEKLLVLKVRYRAKSWDELMEKIVEQLYSEKQ